MTKSSLELKIKKDSRTVLKTPIRLSIKIKPQFTIHFKVLFILLFQITSVKRKTNPCLEY